MINLCKVFLKLLYIKLLLDYYRSNCNGETHSSIIITEFSIPISEKLVLDFPQGNTPGITLTFSGRNVKYIVYLEKNNDMVFLTNP